MKIVYLNGPYDRQLYSRCSRSPAVTKSGTLYYPIWLAYAAGLADQAGEFEVELIDAVARRLDGNDLIGYLQQGGVDVVFCDTSTGSIGRDLATVGAIKSEFPDCRVVLVGTHATAMAESVLLENFFVDAVARGEYDATAIDFVRAVRDGRDWGTVAGLSFRAGDTVEHNEDRELIGDLDSFPFVSQVYEKFLRVEDYFFAAARYPMVMMITSRGCPHRCGWCLYPQVMHRGKYRVRSSGDVAAEFAYISSELGGVQEIGIEDDLFTGDRSRVAEICRLLIEQDNRLGFWCDTRVDLDYEQMRLLKAAGCRSLIVGFESGSQAVLDRIGKGTQVERAYQFMEDARRAKLLVHGCFVLGNPGESAADMERTLAFSRKLNPDTVQFFPMMVYPGTSMYQWAQQEGYLRTDDFGQWLTPEGLHDSVLDLPGLPGGEVVRFCDQARREFYLRKRYVFSKIIQSATNFQEAKRNIKAFRRFAKYLLTTSQTVRD